MITEYKQKGYYIVPEDFIPPLLIQEALEQSEKVISGYYETGRTPPRTWNVGDAKKVQKVDDAHLTNLTLFQVATHPKLGEWAAKVTGAKKIQVCASQLFYKPSKGKDSGNIGWHRDMDHWKSCQGEVFTAWIPLSEITPTCGTLNLIQNSHHWNLQGQVADVYEQDLDLLQKKIEKNQTEKEPWKKIPVIVPVGGGSFHHKRIFHGSGENQTTKPRCSLAVILGTENSELANSADFKQQSYVYDPMIAPIIYDQTKI